MLARGNHVNFHISQTVQRSHTDGHLHVYSQHLQALREDLVRWFQDLSKLVIPEREMDPFIAASSSASVELQENSIDTQERLKKKKKKKKKIENPLQNNGNLVLLGLSL